jgi:RNA polymerase sigma-54 factor
MSVSLQFRAGQHLSMTPFLQRSIQLLQLSSLEFQQQVEEVMGSNPFLEPLETDSEREQADDAGTADSPTAAPEAGASSEASDDTSERDDSDGLRQDEVADGGLFETGTRRATDDDWDPTLGLCATVTLREHLLQQAGCLRLTARDQAIIHTVINAIDDSGYLTQSLVDVAALCPPGIEPEPDELRVALRQVQSLEPAGVGARSVAECLTLQLQALPPQTPSRNLAIEIVRHHLGLLAAHDFQRLQRELGCPEDALHSATVLLRSLSPRPGADFGPSETQFVVADVIVQPAGRGQWVARINPEVIPRIRVCSRYARLLRGHRDGEGTPVSEQVREARWLVRNIDQRFQTILRVAQAIIDHQGRFFEYGAMAMKPLTLGEIADRVGLHESTVSRVTSRKYMATPRGLFEFKHFFGSHVSTAAGAPCSATAVRALITELVAEEDGTRPLSDIKLTRLLEQRGIRVARRTVSKYRDALQIPSVDVRRMSHRPLHMAAQHAH